MGLKVIRPLRSRRAQIRTQSGSMIDAGQVNQSFMKVKICVSSEGSSNKVKTTFYRVIYLQYESLFVINLKMTVAFSSLR